ncbi:MAG: hypothetical protein DLM71_10920 [Chloroflexi bacterium]|nr:MAG: hypothetical protein DLM71_10920 [Chloroflexota bacterium]
MVVESKLEALLSGASVLWLASTCPDGTPHVVPCWFVWDGDELTVLTRADAQKVRNVRCQPRVMVAIGSPGPMFGVELLQGTAVLEETVCRDLVERFERKYAEQMPLAAFDLDSFRGRFTAGIRITPSRLLDWGAREVARRDAASLGSRGLEAVSRGAFGVGTPGPG